MSVSKLALGMNARNYLYIRPNNLRGAKKRADSKLLTKRRLLKGDIPTLGIISEFRTFRDVRAFSWSTLRGSFVLKPSRGYGGAGILVVREWNGSSGKRQGGGVITLEELEVEIFSIIDGAYSIDNLPDVAFLEERIVVSTTMRKMAKRGVPDIRVIVFKGVPVMAMLRLPTKLSEGKANLHQGALGIGIDIRTGITTKGILYGKNITTVPGKKMKVRGIKIPKWSKILKYAVQAQRAVGLGYAGVDIVLDETKGPLVLEVNARPGLQIQLANGASLRTRLERIEDMQVPTVEYGIDLAKHLFAEFALTNIPDTSNVIRVFEKITLYGPKGKKTLTVKVDTGAYSTSIDKSLVDELGFEMHPRVKAVKSGLGSEVRERVDIMFRLHGKDIKTDASFTDRTDLRYPVIIGRRDIKGFLVNPRKLKEKKKDVTK